MKPRNWSICAFGVCMAGVLAACGGQQPTVGRASPGAVLAAGDLAQPLSAFSGETFSTKKINSDCVIDGYSGASFLTINYYVAGKSSGPYPGTFVAKGSAGEATKQGQSTSYGFREEFKITSHRRHFFGVVTSRREFSVQECHGYNDSGFQITRARYRAIHSSGRSAVTLTPQSFSESFH
jgi:hypothetical protein